MTTWLTPIPGLVRRDPEHRYWLDDHLFPVSITGVLAHSKGDVAMGRIEATRQVWAPRGHACHRAMELLLTARRPAELASVLSTEAEPLAELGELADGDYAEWIRPLLTHERWEQVEVIASERATCCLVRNVAGTYDTAFLDDQLPIPSGRPQGVSGPARVLADLKSLGPNGSTYCTRAQLGGYMALEWSHGHWIDYGQTIWCRPGGTAFSPLYGRQECLVAWAAAYTTYAEAHWPF
jgi:hypothetical protein